MIVGVDFDNTIVCYDRAFHRAAGEWGLIPPDVPATKEHVRAYLRNTGREDEWTRLQGYVYGARMDMVEAFAGAARCLRFFREHGIEVYIISHKTLYPFLGMRYNLHEAALNWLATSGFLDEAGVDIRHVFFELTKEEKLARIGALGCSHFIDDLPEILCAGGFPASTVRILFAPGTQDENQGLLTFTSWEEIARYFEDLMADKSEGAPSGIGSRAARLLATAGCSSGGEIIRLGIGGNNRIYRVEGGPRTYVLKEYFCHPGDSRDRLGVEFAFAQFAWASGLRCIPEPIAVDPACGIGLFSFIEGERIPPGKLSRGDIQQAIEFITSLNHGREIPEARELPPGSEACFSIRRHLDVVKSRLDRLSSINPVSPIDHEALEFVHTKLAPALALVTERLLAGLAEEHIRPDTELLPQERVISPSDFGFHNALRRADGKIVFLDFEYAGWDDPAKLTGDFFSQVAVPVPLAFKDEVFNAVAGILPDHEAALRRMLLLLPLYRIKWCCIILNHFLPVDSGRRNFAQGAVSKQKAEQLDKARLLLASLEQVSF